MDLDLDSVYKTPRDRTHSVNNHTLTHIHTLLSLPKPLSLDEAKEV